MLPLASTIRVIPALARLFVWPTSAPNPDSLFQSQSVGSRACILECDINIHKSNSTYLLDLDVSRAALLTLRFAHALRQIRGGAALVLAGVDISFRREIKPLQAYETRSCILAWDHKWIYVLSYHVKPGTPAEVEDGCLEALVGRGEYPESWKGRVFAVAVSKYVAKSGRRTIAPGNLLEAGGYTGSAVGPEDKERLDNIEARRIKGIEMLASFREIK
ncbi:hypothetical protein INS49_012175 [Diaporthe citri]|uniref:uncharacterized protein n=1 Tax=Diaporthe citri TaxID=83186 RepID=UPI001C7E40B4|nr:uncharacterized protein INS49_012175 [Diaporthe citri]KAG6358657.1 hypothetical protein INS49_012175 [Diaporthe citri]